MGGAMRQLLSLLGAINGRPREKKKKMTQRRRLVQQAVELRVRMDCERCEREVKKALSGIRGLQHVEVNRLQQKVTVTGLVDPVAVLRRARSTGKRAEPWPQNPAGFYYAPAAAALYGSIGAAQLQAHDGRWANPAGYYYPYPYPVPVMEAAIGAEQITSLFSDDNPNACSVM